MGETMRFSIVTIAFNQANYVEQAIRSVLAQDYPDLEYIVVDPGSTDGTREIIERYRDRISKIIYQSDDGAADGLNHGFAAATGDVYGFLNSDDLLLPGTLAEVARMLADNPEVGLVMGNMWIIDAEGRRLRKAFTDRFDARALAYGACTICQQSTFFRARLFHETGGFNVRNRIAWDTELFLDMLEAGHRPVRIDTMLSAFRVHRDSVTGSRRQMGIRRDFFMNRFERVMGRSWHAYDELVRAFYLARKYWLEPRSLAERLRHGSIVRRRLTSKI